MTELHRQIPNGLPMKKNVTTYFHTNIYETTSANFATELLQFHINQIGLDRIMYSIDYPFVSLCFFHGPHHVVDTSPLFLFMLLKEMMSDGAAWINSLKSVLTKQNLDSLRREVAIKVLRLNE
jgi:2,3-dihydroxybenzoate decarboxylase